MSNGASYSVCLRDLGADAEVHVWQVGTQFFRDTEQELVSDGAVSVTAKVQRKTARFDIGIHIDGEVTIPCDRCLEPMQQHVCGDLQLEVRFGEEYADDGTTVTVSAEDGCIDLGWNIYECIALAIPISHSHPEGQCDGEMEGLISQHSAQLATDPRWEALKALATDKDDSNK